MSLLSTLLGSMTSEESLDSLSVKTGSTSGVLSGLIAQALPLLLKKLTSNAGTQEGASSLMNALSQHTETTPVAEQIANADAEDGGKILQHILGGSASETFQQLASENGLSQEQVQSALSNISPALLSSLSQATSQGNAAAGAASQVVESLADDKKEEGGILGSLGSIGSLVGSLFGKKDDDKEDESLFDGTSLLSTLMNLGGK